MVLTESREEGGSRSTTWSMTATNGVIHIPPKREREDLFGMDLHRILHKIPSDVNISDIFGFLDRVHAMTYRETT